MPKIYDYFGIAFLFYSEEHLPIHVHVRKAGKENKLIFVYKKGELIDIDVKPIKNKKGLSDTTLKEAIKFAKAKEPQITNKWTDYFYKGKRMKCEKVTKKI